MSSVAFLVNGNYQSALAYRARHFVSWLNEKHRIATFYRTRNKTSSIVVFFCGLFRTRPDIIYVFDLAYSGVIAVGLYKLFFKRAKLVIETGDAVYELMRSTGNRGRLGLLLTRLLESFSLRAADKIVVRGTHHKATLAEKGIENVEVIQDGVDTERFTAMDVSDLRRKYGLEAYLTIGVVGSIVWSEKLKLCYGWELVEAIHILKDSPIKGVIIGEGTGIARLKEKIAEYQIKDKILFLDYQPYEQLPLYLNLIDICLSTQTNNAAGRVRTTGKLPLYLACGRFVLASKVGEASLVLGDDMLVEYDGVKDETYPQKLAARIITLLKNPSLLQKGKGNIALARERFDYKVLGQRMQKLFESLSNEKLNNGLR